MRVLIDDSTLNSGHAQRGVGTYTRRLIDSVSRIPEVSLQHGPWKNLWKTVDLLHFPNFDLYSQTLSLPKVPVVVTIHDVIPLQFPDHYPVGKRGKLSFWRQKRVLSGVAAVITDSHASKEAIHQHLPIALKMIYVIPLAPDPELVTPEQALLQKIKHKYHLPDDYVLYVGDINYNKNLPQLIKSLKYINESIHLVLVGHNFKEQAIPEWTAISQQIALSNVADRVHFLPDIKTGDNTSLASIYAQSLCYIQPSLAEGFGLPVLDALQVGTPVIASNRTSLPEVGGQAAHYAEPTAEAFAKAVTEVAAYSHDKRATVIRAGQAHAATFTWENTARKTIAVYRKVLGME